MPVCNWGIYYHCSLDKNECLENNGGCSDKCVNEDPGYHCECPKGQELDVDEKTCISKLLYYWWYN